MKLLHMDVPNVAGLIISPNQVFSDIYGFNAEYGTYGKIRAIKGKYAQIRVTKPKYSQIVVNIGK